ncbi:peptidoglycan-binding domain-containing protein [Rheinheimera maricola]|uniref:Peptidoglycan-binding protein n=1 Tax=Rheinheimera maricola TaxID=2793282 RepID=A0ABS7X4S2_9GAMM|nr:peptidoglycan-binding domain-containing protein [Rheinheimera maricola]MBZ9610541.1 peptidoglycan-binding protein [Rheinheimera maricola]
MPAIHSHSKRSLLKSFIALCLTSTTVSITVAGELQHRPADNNQWPENLVRAVQEKLSSLGFDTGKADGIIGPRTRQAINAYQQQNAMKVDGQISATLLEALGFEQ